MISRSDQLQQITNFSEDVIIEDPLFIEKRYTKKTFSETAAQQQQLESLQENSEEYYSPVVIVSRQKYESDIFIALQKWEGCVLSVNKETIIAQLRDLTGKESDSQAEIEIGEIPRRDLDMLCPGAYFYWSIGYNDSITDQRTRVSIIRFKRNPVWNKEELDRAKREAAELKDLIGW
jgi:hypothetical protein